VAINMRTPEVETDDLLPVWANCPKCPGCFTGQYKRVRACIPPDAPRPGPRALRPPMGVAPLTPDPYEATKEAICAAYIAGENLLQISNDLNAHGVPTKHAKTWHASTVRKIILQISRALRKERDA